MNKRFKIGDKVIYEGLIAIVEDVGEYFDGGNCYGLVSVVDEELTCTASECDCELFTGQIINENKALLKARLSSSAIRDQVDSITDKYYRDGTH